ncbi:hypothetical protein [Comamonas odontotermitis]|uniref:hypothetical protein n=1 Tax=Comamonas odontotermitis TaxID=379895 RepID=UPI001CC57F84|nr:hypothetical protein [Comamonas odontotermitis]UBB18894.1 hypothetical protein LAD35_09825 [Comamonas odontotermitis]
MALNEKINKRMGVDFTIPSTGQQCHSAETAEQALFTGSAYAARKNQIKSNQIKLFSI